VMIESAADGDQYTGTPSISVRCGATESGPSAMVDLQRG
jgi:hypothetical protein